MPASGLLIGSEIVAGRTLKTTQMETEIEREEWRHPYSEYAGSAEGDGHGA